MTTQWRSETEQERPFGKWIRGEKRLDSIVERTSVLDTDYWCHKYSARAERRNPDDLVSYLDMIMLFELKTFNTELRFAQSDTLEVIDQIMRIATVRNNRRQVIKMDDTRIGSHGKKRTVRWYGVHLLQLSGTRPDESDTILWDKEKVTLDQLVEILQFDRDPDHPTRKIDTRRHHAIRPQPIPLFKRG